MQPDITVIATPNIFHKPMTLAALNAGSNVLCEKPLALTYADAKEMIETAAAKGLILNVGTHYRYTPTTRGPKPTWTAASWARSMRRRCLAAPIGHPRLRRLVHQQGAGRWRRVAGHRHPRAGPCALPHGLPQAGERVRRELRQVRPAGVGLGGWGNETVEPIPNAKFDVDDLAWAFIRFANGAVMQFQVSWAANMPEESCAQLFGTDGGMLVTNNELKLYKLMNGQEVNIDAVVPGGYPSSYGYLMEQFIKRLDGDDSAPIGQEQALTAVQIVDGIMRSAASGQEVNALHHDAGQR
ncbi:MAG: Gfo/Idh/MocA family oxidoreductase [Caldilineaceae bacterium]